MNKLFSLGLALFSLHAQLGYAFSTKQTYTLLNDPIDVVIPAIKKDLDTLDQCIDAIKRYGQNIRNVYVISPEKITDKAIWVDEKVFPFDTYSIALAIYNNEVQAKRYYAKPNRLGWIMQQLFKLYAPFIIKGISSNILLLDSDTIFLRPVSFMNERNEPLFNPGIRGHRPYYDHAKRLIPTFYNVFKKKYFGISHHMLIQRAVMQSLFDTIVAHNKMEPWKAICKHMKIEPSGDVINVGLSEFEIYFNYIFATTHQAHIRKLTWANVASLNAIERYRSAGYHYISNHSYMRDPSSRPWWVAPVGKW